MVPILVILTIVVFILVDVATRLVMKRLDEKRQRRKRQEALDIGLRLEFTEEAPTLKRVEVARPKARILAVDDESVVLDSFRKILVLAGYAVDTVESGPEAVGLVRRNDYDFVFTDLKMPDFDGLEVTKAVRHLRPDIDVAIITGYGTIESAVAAMQFGAMDYVEKPFTEDELVAFTEKLALRRLARLEREIAPKFHLVTAAGGESEEEHVVNVAGGRFVAPEHTWVGVEVTGEATIGLDDFCVKTLGEIGGIELPRLGARVARGQALFTLRRDGVALVFPSPVDGEVTRVNTDLATHLELLRRKPYDFGWICAIDAHDLSRALGRLRLGSEALDWYESDVGRFLERVRGARSARPEPQPATPRAADGRELDRVWEAFDRTFLHPEEVAA